MASDRVEKVLRLLDASMDVGGSVVEVRFLSFFTISSSDDSRQGSFATSQRAFTDLAA